MEKKKRKILIADDDDAIVDAIAIMLDFHGYEVRSTGDGAMVRKMDDDFPDLVLLDMWMSGEDGSHICRQLKNQEHTKHIPIIMISASREAEKKVKEAGADDFIAKPFQMDELIRKVEVYTS